MERQVSIRLPGRLLSAVDRAARRRRRPRAEIVREALETFLSFPNGTFGRPPADRVRGLIGSVADLPPDLATRPGRHLKGLGRGRR